MAKHRSTLYSVVRERNLAGSGPWIDCDEAWHFNAVIGVYVTVARAEEIKGAFMQEMKDKGFTDNDFRFLIQPVTYYDE